MLCTALYGSTSLQQSSKGSCSLLVSGHNLRADCQWRILVPPLNSGANAAPASVLALMWAVVHEWMNGVTQKELSFLLLLWGLSDPRIAELLEMPQCFSIKLHSETQVSGRLGLSGGRSPMSRTPYRASEENALNNPPCPITPTLTSSSVHHSSHQLTTTFLLYYNVT